MSTLSNSEHHLLVYFGPDSNWSIHDQITIKGKFSGFPSAKAVVQYIVQNRNLTTEEQFDDLISFATYIEKDEQLPSDQEIVNQILERFADKEDPAFAMIVDANNDAMYKKIQEDIHDWVAEANQSEFTLSCR